MASGTDPRLTRSESSKHLSTERDLAHRTALVWVALLTASTMGAQQARDDRAVVAALDKQYQAAVKANDTATMNRILADDFVLVNGRGQAFTKADLLESAASRSFTYEQQDDTNQTVRVWGNTAVVTALLWLKGTTKGTAFDYKLWFSDTYVRTPSGWRYVFGQASLRLPAGE